MDAIVLAGGLGTRLRSVVADIPKSMAPICGKPFLDTLLTVLAQKGFHHIILSLGYKAEQIVAYFGNQFAGMQISYEIELQPLGTGGAIRKALHHCRENHAFVFNGDTYVDLEVSIIERQWRIYQRPIIVAREVDDTSRYGRLHSTDGRVTGFAEKGAAGQGLINAGCYVLPVHLLDDFPIGQAFSLESDFLTHTVHQQHIDLFLTQGQFIDIGIPEDYARAQVELRQVVA